MWRCSLTLHGAGSLRPRRRSLPRSRPRPGARRTPVGAPRSPRPPGPPGGDGALDRLVGLRLETAPSAVLQMATHAADREVVDLAVETALQHPGDLGARCFAAGPPAPGPVPHPSPLLGARPAAPNRTLIRRPSPVQPAHHRPPRGGRAPERPPHSSARRCPPAPPPAGTGRGERRARPAQPRPTRRRPPPPPARRRRARTLEGARGWRCGRPTAPVAASSYG